MERSSAEVYADAALYDAVTAEPEGDAGPAASGI
jgi:hypothetical protein